MANAEEDFSFPATTTHPPPCFIESPPLWRPVTRLGNSGSFKDEEVEDKEKFNLCSSQEFKASNFYQRKSSCYDENYEDEKMDILWEDWNEEVSRTCGKTAEESDNSSPRRQVQICCVKALKLSKANGHMLSGKKASILVFISVLKKGFAMHHSRRSIKKHAW
ncbi:hypothetical protein Pfo_017311 [Paulownia fortunei]|nr:hypothetical protein Pfo_017311 [Paulownia fortunei]